MTWLYRFDPATGRYLGRVLKTHPYARWEGRDDLTHVAPPEQLAGRRLHFTTSTWVQVYEPDPPSIEVPVPLPERPPVLPDRGDPRDCHRPLELP